MKTETRKIHTDLRDAMFEEIFDIAKKDRNVILLMGDQGAASFAKFKKEIPSQLINAGIAEQNIVSAAAGLTLGGKKVFAHAITTFLVNRAYEQIKIDVGLMQLPVVLIGVGAGYTYGSDGPTHHVNEDVATMRAIPGMTIYSPADTVSLAAFPHLAYKAKGPVYIRFDKGNVPQLYKTTDDFTVGVGQLKKGEDVTLIATGLMVHKALAVAAELEKKGVKAGVIDIYRLKPLNERMLTRYLKGARAVVVMEEHSIYGGLASIIADFLADTDMHLRFKRFGIPDKNSFDYGDREYMHEKIGLGTAKIIKDIVTWLK